MADVSLTPMIPKAPMAKYFVNMNRLYLLLDINEYCRTEELISSVLITVVAHESDDNGNLDPDQVIISRTYSYPWSQIIHNRVIDSNFDPYNIWVNIKNYWYRVIIQLVYNESSEVSPSENYVWYSELLEFKFNNSSPILTGKEVSNYMQGQLKDFLAENKFFTCWLNLDTKDSYFRPEINDLIAMTTNPIGVKQVIDIYENELGETEYQLDFVDESFLNIYKFIINQPMLTDLLNEYYDENIPDYGQITFNIILNQNRRDVVFAGDLKILLR